MVDSTSMRQVTIVGYTDLAGRMGEQASAMQLGCKALSREPIPSKPCTRNRKTLRLLTFNQLAEGRGTFSLGPKAIL